MVIKGMLNIKEPLILYPNPTCWTMESVVGIRGEMNMALEDPLRDI